jgi:23S rRNA (guanosine2251-2'-O)-methyltransferase
MTPPDPGAQDLATEDFKGSSALRAYTSFVNPRANRKPNNRETHEEGAARTAVQVGFLMREQRALLSEYLRSAPAPLIRHAAAPPRRRAAALPRRRAGQGAEARGRRNVDAAAAELAAREVVPHPLVLVLDNVRSAHNVGSIFRTAETACVREIVTCGITPHPPNEKLDKTALSATHFVPSRHFASTLDALAALRAEGVHVVGMETTSRSVFHTRAEYPQPTALVLGNELTGIDTQATRPAPPRPSPPHLPPLLGTRPAREV